MREYDEEVREEELFRTLKDGCEFAFLGDTKEGMVCCHNRYVGLPEEISCRSAICPMLGKKHEVV